MTLFLIIIGTNVSVKLGKACSIKIIMFKHVLYLPWRSFLILCRPASLSTLTTNAAGCVYKQKRLPRSDSLINFIFAQRAVFKSQNFCKSISSWTILLLIAVILFFSQTLVASVKLIISEAKFWISYQLPVAICKKVIEAELVW